jgi:tripartite-type tricarboxylate transporter receptor subunit TctC
VVDAIRRPEVQQRFADLGLEPVGSTPDQAARFIREEAGRWQKVIKDAKVSID